MDLPYGARACRSRIRLSVIPGCARTLHLRAYRSCVAYGVCICVYVCVACRILLCVRARYSFWVVFIRLPVASLWQRPRAPTHAPTHENGFANSHTSTTRTVSAARAICGRPRNVARSAPAVFEVFCVSMRWPLLQPMVTMKRRGIGSKARAMTTRTCRASWTSLPIDTGAGGRAFKLTKIRLTAQLSLCWVDPPDDMACDCDGVRIE